MFDMLLSNDIEYTTINCKTLNIAKYRAEEGRKWYSELRLSTPFQRARFSPKSKACHTVSRICFLC